MLKEFIIIHLYEIILSEYIKVKMNGLGISMEHAYREFAQIKSFCPSHNSPRYSAELDNNRSAEFD